MARVLNSLGVDLGVELAHDPHFPIFAQRLTPVIVLTSSEAEVDILRSYELDANAYLTKPVDLKQFAQKVQAIDRFWFQVVKLPPR